MRIKFNFILNYKNISKNIKYFKIMILSLDNNKLFNNFNDYINAIRLHNKR